MSNKRQEIENLCDIGARYDQAPNVGVYEETCRSEKYRFDDRLMGLLPLREREVNKKMDVGQHTRDWLDM